MIRPIDKRNECLKCEMEDDRCDHSQLTELDIKILTYVKSMPRYPFLNSVNRYSMYLLFREAFLGHAPTSQKDYEPKQPKE